MSKNKSVMEVMRYGAHGHYTCVLGKDLDVLEEFAETQKAAIELATVGLDMGAAELDKLIKANAALEEALTLAKAERDSYQRVGIATMEKLAKAKELLKDTLVKTDEQHEFWREVKLFIADQPQHILYRDGDACIPSSILDRNGQVALDLCTVCGKGEAELDGPCDGKV